MQEIQNTLLFEPKTNKSRWGWAIFILVCLAVIVVVFKITLPEGTALTPQEQITPSQPKPSPPVSGDPRITHRTSKTELNQAEFDSEEAYYLNLAQRQNPKAALQMLRTNIETDLPLLRSCHALTHSIGQAAYIKYQDFEAAMKYLDEVCNTGYMHGIIEAKFKRSADIEHEVLTTCTNHTEGRCLHGVGHGLMFYTENNLPKSLSLCEQLAKTSEVLYCAEGVFMENFNTDQKTHPSKYLSDSNLFYPCSEQAGRYKNACYYYAPLHYFGIYKSDYSAGLAWCNEAEANYILQCVRGVAAVAIKQNMNTPTLVEAACMTAKQNQIAHCIDGMVGLYINHYNSLEKAYGMCQALLVRNQKACTAGVKSREATFEGEVKGASI